MFSKVPVIFGFYYKLSVSSLLLLFYHNLYIFCRKSVCKYFGSDSFVDAAYEIYQSLSDREKNFPRLQNLYEHVSDHMVTDLSINFG